MERFFEHRDEKYFDKAHARMIMDEWLYMLRHKSQRTVLPTGCLNSIKVLLRSTFLSKKILVKVKFFLDFLSKFHYNNKHKEKGTEKEISNDRFKRTQRK